MLSDLINDDKELNNYISKLTSFSVDRLRKEPSLLLAEKERVRGEMLQLAYEHYADFIEASDCVSDASASAHQIGEDLNRVDVGLERLQEACQRFQGEAKRVARERQQNQAAFAQIASLQRLMELPRVMRACVKAGKYDEALQLNEYVTKLTQQSFPQPSPTLTADSVPPAASAHTLESASASQQLPLSSSSSSLPLANISVASSQSLSIIRSIGEECTQVVEELVQTLQERLRGSDVTLPVSLRLIGYLKRMKTHSDVELRLVFLRSRDECLKQLFKSMTKATTSLVGEKERVEKQQQPSDSDSAATAPSQEAAYSVTPYAYLSKFADLSRTHLFDIVTQYRAIFGDDERPSTSSHGASSLIDPESILNGWLLVKVEEFIAEMRRVLPEIETGASLANLLDTCLHFGQSLGRIGVDCSNLLVPLFVERVYILFVAQIRYNTSKFIRNVMQTKHFVSLPEIPSFEKKTAGASEPLQPPPALAAFPSLGALLNSFIDAFNELRNCAPLILAPTLATEIKDELIKLSNALRETRQSRSMDNEEAAAFGEICKLYAELFVPHVVKLFSTIYPAADKIEFLPILSPVATLYTAE